MALAAYRYQRAPHGRLYGKLPADAWASATHAPSTSGGLPPRSRRGRRAAFVAKARSMSTAHRELDRGFLAGVLFPIALDKTDAVPRVVEHDGIATCSGAVDPIAAGMTRRKSREAPRSKAPFDPGGALLDKFAGRPPRHLDPRGLR